MIKRIFAAIVASLFMLGLTGPIAGCNTMAGIGQDVSSGGDKIKEEAREHKRY